MCMHVNADEDTHKATYKNKKDSRGWEANLKSADGHSDLAEQKKP
jgi:hypothetical protein